MTRIGVYGGTFDPPTVAHVAVASEAIHALDLDRLIVVPAGDPYQKVGVSAAEHRVAMCHLAWAGNPKVTVDRVEVDRPGPSYMVDTITEITARHPDAELVVLVGTDQAVSLRSWHRWDDLSRMAEFVGVCRPGYPPAADGGAPVSRWIEPPVPALSSTAVRWAAAHGATIDGMVPAAVRLYLDERPLYAAVAA